MDEKAWLIEMPAARWGTGFYWTNEYTWSQWGTIDKAIRFARKIDADRIIAAINREEYEKLVLEACEHEWPKPNAAGKVPAEGGSP